MVHEVSLSPDDEPVALAVGDSLIQFLELTDNGLVELAPSQSGLTPAETEGQVREGQLHEGRERECYY